MSVASDDGGRCVDVFEHRDGGFGFEEFRSDPEDAGGWTAIGGFAATRHRSAAAAADAALAHVAWLQMGAPRAAFDAWTATLHP